MTKMKQLLLTLLIPLSLGLTPIANAETVLYCHEIVSAGVSFEDKDGGWQATTYDNRRWTIQVASDHSWIRTEFPKQAKIRKVPCSPFGLDDPFAWYGCYSSSGDTFFLSKDLTKFQYSNLNPFSYVIEHIDGDPSPSHVSLGNCEKF